MKIHFVNEKEQLTVMWDIKHIMFQDQKEGAKSIAIVTKIDPKGKQTKIHMAAARVIAVIE